MLTEEALSALMPVVCKACSMLFRGRLVIISPLQAAALLVDTLVSLMGELLHSSFIIVPTPFHDAGLKTLSQHARALRTPCLPTADPRYWGEINSIETLLLDLAVLSLQAVAVGPLRAGRAARRGTVAARPSIGAHRRNAAPRLGRLRPLAQRRPHGARPDVFRQHHHCGGGGGGAAWYKPARQPGERACRVAGCLAPPQVFRASCACATVCTVCLEYIAHNADSSSWLLRRRPPHRLQAAGTPAPAGTTPLPAAALAAGPAWLQQAGRAPGRRRQSAGIETANHTFRWTTRILYSRARGEHSIFQVAILELPPTFEIATSSRHCGLRVAWKDRFQ